MVDNYICNCLRISIKCHSELSAAKNLALDATRETVNGYLYLIPVLDNYP
jgi:hypothetical protein